MKSRFLALALALTSSALSQSTPSTPPPAASTNDLPDAPGATSTIKPPVVPTGPTAIIDTSMGRLTCKFYDQQAPVTVANFIGLAEGTKDWTDADTLKKIHGKPYYNSTIFHRVIPGFMIQGGDRLGTGSGDPGYLFQDEIDSSLGFDQPGRLAMANAGLGPSGQGTNGSQFFITEVPVPELNGKHTIFGQCDANTVLLVTKIARVERDHNDKPITPVTINRVTIVREGQPVPPDPMPPAPTPAAAPVPTAPTQ
jgi:peptidyl-prolyl cis-trans isomerase A (cyclophilin A)